MDEIKEYMDVDFDYILYETLECGMIQKDIPYLTNIKHMERAKDKLNAVIIDCTTTIEKIDKRLKEIENMSYEDVDDTKEKLYNAYMKACQIAGEHTTFKPVKVVAFESGKRKYSIRIDEAK